ncbi:MAG: GtrA family protein [Solirubrobacterales bacterium]|nr:GtrA family protein [Solirubrobacterales bacterium]
MPAGEHQRLLRFGIVGLGGSVLGIALFSLMVGPLGLDHRVAAALSTSCALSVTFVVNRRWTFEAEDGLARSQAWKFLLVSLVAVGVNVAAVAVLVDVAGVPKVLGAVLAVGFQAPVSYVGNRVWTFAGTPLEI